MAEIVGVVASAVTLAATAQGAAQLSKVVFKVVATFKNAPQQMALIARGLSQFSGSLQTLADIINHCEKLCKPKFFESIKDILSGYRQVEADLRKLIDTGTSDKLLKLRWCMQKPKAKDLLKRIEGIKIALTLELLILQLAKEQVIQTHATKNTASQATPQPNRWRSVVETVVQANKQVVESAQREDIEDAVQKNSHLEGKRTELDLWKESSFDTATWLYHLVFGPSVQEPPYQASVSEESPERHEGTVSLRSISDRVSKHATFPNREIIVWNARTEPSYVVDKLLFAWTTLSSEQISLSSVRHEDCNDWRNNVLKLLDEAKEVDKEDVTDSESSVTDAEASDLGEIWNKRLTEVERRTKRSATSDSREPSVPRPQVRFERTPESKPNDSRTPNISSSKSAVSHSSMPTVYTIDSDDAVTKNGRELHVMSPASKPTSTEEDDHWGWSTIEKKTKKIDATETVPVRPGSTTKVHYAETSGRLHKEPKKDLESQSKKKATTMDVLSGEHTRSTSRSGGTQREFPGNDSYAHPLYRSRSNNYAAPLYHSDPQWNPFSYPPMGAMPASYGPPAPPPLPPVVSANDPRLSRIEDLLAVQQDNSAQIRYTQAVGNDGTATKHLSVVTDEYNKTIQELKRSLNQQKETQQKAEADNLAERRCMMAAAEEKLAMIHRLERFVTQQKDEQQKAEETWRFEKQTLHDRVAQAAEMKEAALRDVMTARSATEAVQKSLGMLKEEAEAEKRSRVENEIKAAEARRKADVDHKENYQHYEKLLKASKEVSKKTVPRKEESHACRPVRQTIIRDNSRSIEVNEYTTEALGSSVASSLSSLMFYQDDARHSEVEARMNDRSWPRRERLNSSDNLSRSPQSSRMSLSGFSNKITAQKTQQTILFPTRSTADSARMSDLQASLARLGISAIINDMQDPTHDEVVLFNGRNEQIVQSTVFWEAPVMTLGSELLSTMRQSGWKPIYSRRSAGGRTYFLGDQPVHAYFFQDHYKPHFLPPSSPAAQDAVIVDKALIEEYALQELNFPFQLTAAGEYELDARLTFGDIESLIERSFAKREDAFRRQYAQLRWHRHSTAPSFNTTFQHMYAPSTASTMSRSSRQSCGSTEMGQTEGEEFESSQTSPSDLHEGNSEWGGECDVGPSPSVASWTAKSVNPFRLCGKDGGARSSNNPWGGQSRWDGSSLI